MTDDPGAEYLILYATLAEGNTVVEDAQPRELKPDFVRTTAEGPRADASRIGPDLLELLRQAGWVRVYEHIWSPTVNLTSGRETEAGFAWHAFKRIAQCLQRG
jgi:hypothetical protein